MKDNRLSCKIVAEQPRLNVTLNLPESMFQGMIFFKMILIYYMVQFSNMLSISFCRSNTISFINVTKRW